MSSIVQARDTPADRIRTTITVWLGTKHMLQDRAKKGESYDRLIHRLVGRLDRLEIENAYLEGRLRELGEAKSNLAQSIPVERTRGMIEVLRISHEGKGRGRTEATERLRIMYGYNRPRDPPPPEGYTMDIEPTSVFRDDGEASFEDVFPDGKDWAVCRLLMVADVIRLRFNPTYIAPDVSAINIVDARYWRDVYETYGVPWSSYNADVLWIIEECGRRGDDDGSGAQHVPVEKVLS
jgi:hypothetical protein